MKQNSLIPLALAGLVLAAACSDSTGNSLTSDSELSADLVATAGDAIARDVQELVANEMFVGAALPNSTPPQPLFTPPSWNVVRSRTCYDAQQQEQAQCDATTTASIVFTVAIDGSVERQHTGPRGTENVTITVHRDRELTISGLAGTETFRVHDGFGSSADTATFAGTHDGVSHTRIIRETSNDTTEAVRFNLPHSTIPWPVSGRIIRNSAGTVDITVGDRHETRSFARRIVVTFPADNQGNVPITINERSCTLNLVTRAVVCGQS